MIGLSESQLPGAVLVLLVVGALTGLAGLAGLLWRRRRVRAFGPGSDRARSGPRAVAEPDVVVADDGARLHVEVDDLPGAAVTVVFVHGYTARLQEFELQRAALRGRARLVLYDQRGHGRSGWGDVRNATIAQLGKDLGAVLDRHAPAGPVVLVGHSLGGMTVLSLVRQRPELVGQRVRGVFLLATSAGDLFSGGLPGLVARFGKRVGLLPFWLRWLRVTAPAVDRMRRRGTTLGYAWTRYYLFGPDDVTPANVRLVQNMLEQTPLTIAAAFYPTFLEHDETAALPVLRRVPVTVLVGDGDELTPETHSRRMAEQIGPSAELVVVPGAGHSVNITRPEVVDAALLRLLDRVHAAPTAASA